MIVLKQKPLDWILERLAPYQKVAVVGCGTCATVCLAGGEREVEELCCALQLAANEQGREGEFSGLTVKRLCDWEFIEPELDTLNGAEVVLSLSCGAGTNLLADKLTDKPILPGVDTCFIGANEGVDAWSEMCAACGDCVLDQTFGICPIARCSKNLLNGPCGGSDGGNCEVNSEMECGWAKIVERAKALGRLDDLERVIPPKDWSSGRHGGRRSLKREDLALSHLVTEDLDEG